MTQQTPPSSIAAIFDAELRDEESEFQRHRPAPTDGTSPPAIVPEPPFEPRFNVAPTDPLTVVVHRTDGRMVEEHRWGLIPSWARSASEGARLINARAETVASSPAFRTAFAKRRCIVPSDGFDQWRRVDGSRQPFFLHPPADGLLAMAGLWSVWKDPATGMWVPSAAVITTRANQMVAAIHDRMPVLLPRDTWQAWLDPDSADPGYLASVLVPAPDDALAMHPVSKAVNSVRNDGPELIVQVPEADPPASPPRSATRARRAPHPAQGTLFD